MASKASFVSVLMLLVAVANAYDVTNCPSNTGRQRNLVYDNLLSGVSINVRMPPAGYFNRPITCLQLIDRQGTSVSPKIVEGGYLDTYMVVNITSLNGQVLYYQAQIYID
ncbi:uncharacterized protein LOC114325748 [Diabrotica virgifera virgifera]|uniref:Uncharacterized protein LOC114325748 n=1 Tax=Diabrotica virgifera virgifera TaxID=50390 RepID=A0A6P7F895_DIAVI|nr:uncharacterized protein LOC114325748 [Diabrotica virgifera virgifera]